MVKFQLNTKYTLDNWSLPTTDEFDFIYIEIQSLDDTNIVDKDGNPMYLAKIYRQRSLPSLTYVSAINDWKLYNEPEIR